MLMRRLIVSCLVGGALAAASGFAPPKPPKKPPKQPSKQSSDPKPFTEEGTIESVDANQFVFEIKQRKKKKNAKGEDKTRTVLLQATTKIQISGEAKPDYLAPGQTVEYTGGGESAFGARPVKAITVLDTPIRTGSGKVGAARGFREPAKDSSGLADAQPKTVTGRLEKSLGDKKWAVRVGGKTTEIELADDAKITVVLSDPKLMNKGDYVLVEGKTVPGKPRQCQAEKVSVKLADPLGVKKKPTAKGGK